ncbi:Similar to putative Heat shock 70 kDa protein 12A [Glarea lozoyensis 74030]; acc. no. EHL02286 [Pyronema omphalodes CBS 100304]|uniref:Similar to putative Heat shock 70 kDa protein 12A [Glarea lozoyensis 74030] acc. no. EHL02286 n=1 Tax=Pyronema omphalodes (strain CBS 100304) TaxID=1076935 RepID=U4LD85_PYROM|nr:Similar to putative Heat shock 70 kDa protein 12A [Glarea lozoyensis 74030]; acc. no. EHL02286 [Pyronema omphalodes CBS 100304]
MMRSKRVYKCELNGKYWVDDSLTWSLEKDMVIGNTATTTFSLYQELREPISTRDLIFDDKILICRENKAPDFIWRDDSLIKRLCTLSTDVSYISHERFERKISPRGVHYYIVSYKVRMTLLNES